MGVDNRNAVINAIYYALSNNISTVNGVPISGADSFSAQSPNAMRYPAPSGGGHYEATIDGGEIRNTGEAWSYTFTLTATDGKHIAVAINCDPASELNYTQIAVTLE